MHFIINIDIFIDNNNKSKVKVKYTAVLFKDIIYPLIFLGEGLHLNIYHETLTNKTND